MVLLTIDQGNTFTKLGVFSGETLKEAVSVNDLSLESEMARLINNHDVTNAVLSSVRKTSESLHDLVPTNVPLFLPNSSSRFAFEINYQNKENIGFDRLANASGAVKKMPKKNILVVDCGTCITYTLLTNSVLKGGAIAPGITMRLKALNYYTGRLPLLERSDKLSDIPGQSTEGSIRVGAELGAVLETDALITLFCSKTPELNVILTGGGMSFFERHLKSTTFAAPYLTLEGLHEIFLLNNK